MRLTPTQRLVLEHRRAVCDALAPWEEASPLAASTRRKFRPLPIGQLHDMFEREGVLVEDGCVPSPLACAARSCSVLVRLHPDLA